VEVGLRGGAWYVGCEELQLVVMKLSDIGSEVSA